MSSLKAWCMFDNHTFARVDLTTRDEIVERVKYLRSLNMGMTLFVREGGVEFGSPFELHERDASDSAITDWADRVLSEVAFRKLMDA